MAFINYSNKSIAIKIVYYGPGLSGKTTNLRHIYAKLDEESRGELICLETPTERTLFFDLLPIKAGMIQDFETHFHLLTVPGQVFYEASRKSVVRGADGIIFVADSQVPMLDANLENFDSLRRNLLEYNLDLNLLPLVFQYNKRDLDNLIPIETFNSLLNPEEAPYIESSALQGKGVFETLSEIAKLVVPKVRQEVFWEGIEKETKEKAKPQPEKQPDIRPEKKEPSEEVPITKVQYSSQDEVDREIENLTKKSTE